MSRSRTSRSKERDWVVVGLLSSMVLVVVLCVVSVVQVGRFDSVPRWWSAFDQSKISEQAGIELENRITSALTRVRIDGEEDWVAAIDQDQLNSWLAYRLRDTIESFVDQDAAQTIGEIRVVLAPTGMTIGTKLDHARGSSIVWAVIEPGTNSDGRFSVRTKRAYLGSARIPSGLASGYLTSDRLGRASVDLGDGRVVLIRGIRTGEHRLELALRTQVK